MTERDTVPLLPTTSSTSTNDSLSKWRTSPWAGTIGSVSMLLAATSFSVGGLFLRTSETVYHLPPIQSTFLLFIAATFTMTLLMALLRPSLSVAPAHVPYVVARCVFGSLSALCYVQAAARIDIGDVSVAFNVCPAATLVLAALFLHERIKHIDILSLILSIIGVILITRPTTTTTTSVSASHEHVLGALFAATSGIMAAIAYVSLRKVSQDVHFMATALFFFLSATALSVALGGVPSSDQFREYGVPTVAYIVGAGVCNAFAQMFLNVGLVMCHVGPAVFIRTLEIPMQYLLGFLFLAETMSGIQVAAAALIVASTAIIGVRNVTTTDSDR